MLKTGDDVDFIGIEGMDSFYPMKTTIIEITTFGMYMIAHPNGFIDSNNNLTVCVGKEHLKLIG